MIRATTVNDLCNNCKHPWHGLSCTFHNTKYLTGGGQVTEKCNCPSQFKLKD